MRTKKNQGKRVLKDRVIFRKFPDGEIIALFPNLVCDYYGNIISYMHVGQHAAAAVGIVKDTKPASPKEFAPLYNELKKIGYNLQVGKRLTKKNSF